MWSLIGKPQTIKVTRAIAMAFRDMEAPPQDRPLNERRLHVYSQLLKEGRFRPVAWAQCYCKQNDKNYRINGKHTATLLADADPVTEFYAVMEYYHADTLEDVARLYSSYDSKIMSRSTTDINKAFAATVPDFQGIPVKTIGLAVSGISFSTLLEQYASVPPQDRAEALLKYQGFVLWLHDIISPTMARPLARLPVAAAMFLTYQKAGNVSTDFWTAVRDETGFSPNLPDRQLAKWLNVMSVNNGKGSMASTGRRASMREFFVKCIYAWNAWREGRSVEFLKYTSGVKIPPVI